MLWVGTEIDSANVALICSQRADGFANGWVALDSAAAGAVAPVLCCTSASSG